MYIRGAHSNPVVLKSLTGSHSVLCVFLQQSRYELLCLCRDLVKLLSVEVVASLLDSVHHHHRIVREEGRGATKTRGETGRERQGESLSEKNGEVPLRLGERQGGRDRESHCQRRRERCH